MVVFWRSKFARHQALTFAIGGLGFCGAGLWVWVAQAEVGGAVLMGLLGLIYLVGAGMMIQKRLVVGDDFVEVRRMGFRRRVLVRDVVEWGMTGSGSGVLFRFMDDRCYWMSPRDFEDWLEVVRRVEGLMEGVPRIEKGLCPGFLSWVGSVFGSIDEFEGDNQGIVASRRGNRERYRWSELDALRLERDERHGLETLHLTFGGRTVAVLNSHFNYDEIRDLAMESRVVRRR